MTLTDGARMTLLISSVTAMVGVASVGIAAQPGGTMDRSGGWMNGGAGGAQWVWIVVGILVVVLLVVLITKQFSNKS